MKIDPWIELIEENGWTDMQLDLLIAAAESILYERNNLAALNEQLTYSSQSHQTEYSSVR